VLEFGIRSLLSEITRFSKVIYLSEIPAFKTAPSCFLRAVRLPTTTCAPERDRIGVEREIAPYDRVLERARQAFPQIQLVNSIDVLCAEDICSQRPLGKPILYSDSIHLSPAGGRLLVEHTGLTKRIAEDLMPAGSG
jgi:hypothetical protein